MTADPLDRTDASTGDNRSRKPTRRRVLKAASGAVVAGTGVALGGGTVAAQPDGNCDQGWLTPPSDYPVLDIQTSDPSTSGDFPSGEDEFLPFVHGWTEEDGATTEELSAIAYTFDQALEDNGYTQSTFLVRWDADHAWDTAKSKADEAGKRLAKWLDDYMSNHSTTVKLSGHSLGSRVTFACLNWLASNTDHVLDDVAVMGAAVNPDTVCDGAKYAPGIKNAATLVNSYSSDSDDIDCQFYKTEEGTHALGCEGSECDCTPSGCSESSISNYTDNQVDFVEYHCDYMKPDKGCVPEIVCDFDDDCDGNYGDGDGDGGGGGGGGGPPL